MKKIILSIILAILTLAGASSADFLSDVIVTSPNGIWTDSRAYSSLNAAITAVGANDREVVIVSPQAVTTLTVPSNVRLKFLRNGSITNSGYLNIQTTNIEAENRQIFTGVGNIDFADGTILKTGWFSNVESAFALTTNDTVTLVVSKSQTLTANYSPGNNVVLKWESPGNILTVAAGREVGNLKLIEAGRYQIFAGAGDFDFLDGTILRSSWFNRLRSVTTWIESEEVKLIADKNEEIDTNVTISANTTFEILPGVIISDNANEDLTINGPFHAGLSQCFDWTGSGQVLLASADISWVYPQWFGAISGGTDCTAAINQALRAGYTGSVLTEGVPIFISRGTWYISDTLLVPYNCYIAGTGKMSIIYLADNSDCDMIARYEGPGSGGKNYTYRDFALDGNKSNQSSGNGIVHSLTYFSKMQNLYIHDIKEVGIVFGDSTPYEQAGTTYVTELVIEDCGSHAIVLDKTHSVNVENTIMEGNGGCGIFVFKDSAQSRIVGNYFEGNTGPYEIGCDTDQHMHTFTISDNYFNSSGCDPVIYLGDDSEFNRIENNRILHDVNFVKIDGADAYYNIIGQNRFTQSAVESKIIEWENARTPNVGNVILHKITENQSYENLIRGGSFEDWGQGTSADPDYWFYTRTAGANGLITQQAAEANYGQYCTKIMFDAAGAGNTHYFSTPIPLLHDDTPYTLSFRYKTNMSSDNMWQVGVGSAKNTLGDNTVIILDNDEDWHRADVTIRTTAATADWVGFFIYNRSVTLTDYLQIDNVVLQRGYNAFPEISTHRDQNFVVQSTSLDLSGAAATSITLHKEKACTLYKATFLYTEASSADAGITMKIGKETDDDYYYTGTSETGKAQWYSVNLTLLMQDVGEGDTVILSSAGGKVGTGEIMLVLEYSIDPN